ncbi:hypothetical protein BHECKSOX2_598 [Bathymodiolus heckerae thiotrophic gill symbiont]|uniref:hypothetical protein n=1 Tax=Bathymodiolus heckerae thiotrophic gill symbiont TaxID=1052212 RepID=UPI0010BBC7B0|nr:hypothetical protein [Bathymodiolus heckerae thiotrophic gill symbiont]SMN13535.1 hypothetical protein BHECKSOX2_598 [Bathymodiolus heckerae thiotrophic gill symbiont]SMN15929.1 hypothetical protein CRYPD_809 [uncultured Candidatus Thioglobus sp.]
MIKLSVSKAARMLGISRFDIQNQINNGKLQTHEGYVTTDSLRLAYPNTNLDSEQDQRIQKMQQIKNAAVMKMEVDTATHDKNKQAYMGVITNLKSKLYKEEIKNQHYEMVFSELTERLKILEKHCHSKDKAALHKLQNWIESSH